MFKKSDLFIFVLTIIQVSARYKSVEPNIHTGNPTTGINTDPAEVSSSSSRIVSGWVAEPGQHPHHAALRMMGSNGGVLVCGGSIISKEWVLTTGHCTNNLVLVVVRVGVVSISDNNPENIFETSVWYNHPSFNPSIIAQRHSTALIKLQRPLVYTRLVKRIQLQSSADAFRDYNGLQVYTSGHGMTASTGSNSDVLRWVYLRAISNSACRSTYASVVFDTTICARYYNVTSQSNCYGDIGGPLVHVSADGVPTLIGVSYFFNTRGCHLGLPTGFERPGPNLPWYKERTGIDFENLQEEDEDDTTVADTTITTTPTTTSETTATFRSTPESDDFTPDDFTPEDNTTPDNFTPEDETTPDNFTPEDDTTPDNFTPEDDTTPDNFTPDDFTPEDNTTPDNFTPEDDTTPDNFTPEDNTTLPPEDTEDKEEEDSDSSESNEDNDMVQLLKRLEVKVKVKVALNKYNVTSISKQ